MLVWQTTGPRGTEGRAGPRGATGATGDTGLQGPAGVAQDRQIESFQNGVWVAKFVDPSVASRYGIFVYVNCATAKTKKA